MTLKRQERHQSCPDLSNHLKMVLTAMPASTQPPSVSRRQVDPHSTQPDLPLLYDALQNQSEVGTNLESQDVSDTAPISISQPSSPSTPRCPHCNGQLLRQAAFCTHSC